MTAVFRREFRSYFRGMLGYLIVALFLVAEGVLFTAQNLILGSPSYEYTLWTFSPVLVILLPLLSMRSVAGDRRGHTDQLLASLPLSAGEIVLGKFLATFSVFAIPTLIGGLYALLMCFFGKVNLLAAYASLFAFLLLGAALLAVCNFLSSLSRNQAIAAVVGIVALLALYLLPYLALILPASPLVSFLIVVGLVLLVALAVLAATKKPIPALVTAACGILPAALAYALDQGLYKNLAKHLLTYVSPFSWFDSFGQNLIFDLRGIVCLISVTGLFLFLTVLSVRNRRA